MRKLVHQAQTGALKPLAVREAAPPSAASLDLLVIDEGEDVKLEEDVAARRHVARELAHQVEQPLRVDLEARLVRLADGAQREMDEREAIVELKLLGRLEVDEALRWVRHLATQVDRAHRQRELRRVKRDAEAEPLVLLGARVAAPLQLGDAVMQRVRLDHDPHRRVAVHEDGLGGLDVHGVQHALRHRRPVDQRQHQARRLFAEGELQRRRLVEPA
mmetsp:Transcript_9762/g.29811  ORF Transcript_9762/g.29811 Transcript_9762/m.29811 type:complete len:217 (+) Transcript_9762:131-781(+)